MKKMLKLSPVLFLSVILVGCASTITNLTPSRQPRNATGCYPVEVAWDTREQAVRWATLQPVVVVDFGTFPMRPTLGMSNRWEAVIRVPSDKNVVPYHIRFDYDYNTFGKPQKSSRLSPGYRLEILDNK